MGRCIYSRLVCIWGQRVGEVGGGLHPARGGASGAIQLFITPSDWGGREGGESGLHQKHMHMTPSPTLTSLHFQTPTSGDTHSHPCIHFLVILGKKMDQRDFFFFFFTSWLSFCLNKLAPPPPCVDSAEGCIQWMRERVKTEGGGHVRLQVFASSTAETAGDKKRRMR